jgi:signal transduction histidine kinase
MLSELEKQLDQFEREVVFGEVSDDPFHHREPWRRVIEMSAMAAQVPTPEPYLGRRLSDARNIYKSRFYLVCSALAVTVLLFLGLIRCGYLWIFVPIRKLHEGASRVAAGDFDYRVKLTGRDEMVALADTFNQVVNTFQEIKSKLDGEVHERSRQLVRSERLAGVGFLAAGVAHEINNPLSAIAMASESLESRLHEPAFTDGRPAPEDLALVTQYLNMIQSEAFRCQKITARLLDFARGHDAPRTRQDLSKIISEVLDMVSHMSKFRGHNVVFDRQRTCLAEVNGSEIKQVVLNLLANALESMEGQGTVWIDFEERADEVILSLRDNGCGMTPYVLENLFEPFFTERKSGKGTGLGLSISHRIVSEHGGRMEALSDGPGKGSCFRIHLPRKAKAQLAKAA